MTQKFIKISIEETTRKAFQEKAKANGVTMTALVQRWINEYLADETVTIDPKILPADEVEKRLALLETKVENSLQKPTETNQETEEKLTQYIEYVDQRIDTLENIVITPLKEEINGLKSSWKALFNQVRDLQGKINQIATNLEHWRQQTQQQFNKVGQFINQKFSQKDSTTDREK